MGGVALKHKMQPNEAVYERAPYTLLDCVGNDSKVEVVHNLFSNRTQPLSSLKENLLRAQNRIRNQANTKWRMLPFR